MIVATTPRTRSTYGSVVAAFVLGGVLSVIAGFVVNGISTGGSAASLASEGDSRFGGGSGDPNFLGAGLVPAIVLAGALMRQVRDPMARWMLAVAMLVLSIGLAASQSRGGLIAAVVALLAALVLYRRKLPILAFLGLAVAFLGPVRRDPQTWERIMTFDDGGSGRQDLWEVGWRIFEELVNVGLNNFRKELFDMCASQALERVDLVAERPRIVHNVYLQLLVETGVVGLALFMIVVLGCLRSMWVAGRRFDSAGDTALGDSSRSVFVATLATLAASFFLELVRQPGVDSLRTRAGALGGGDRHTEGPRTTARAPLALLEERGHPGAFGLERVAANPLQPPGNQPIP